MASGTTMWLHARVTSGSQTVDMGTIPKGAYVVRGSMETRTAWNASGSDSVRCGFSGTPQAYITNTDVSSVAVHAVTLGASIGLQTVARTVQASYVAGSGTPTQGTTDVYLEIFIARAP